jgi:hypothetical protein
MFPAALSYRPPQPCSMSRLLALPKSPPTPRQTLIHPSPHPSPPPPLPPPPPQAVVLGIKSLAGSGMDPRAFGFLEPPPVERLEAALMHLQQASDRCPPLPLPSLSI